MGAFPICPCCGEPVTIKIRPPKWQGEKPKAVITHKKWQDEYRRNMNV